jgi:hypothetical protein
VPRTLFRILVLLASGAAAGCGSEPPAGASPAQPAAPTGSSAFRPDDCGTVAGFVTWVGPIPTVEPAVRVVPRADGSGVDTHTVPMANAPRIAPFTRGLAGTVVFLREIDSARARPWDLPDVVVEFRAEQISVQQGNVSARAGFVRRGQKVTFRSAEGTRDKPEFRLLRGRGAAYFAIPFPDHDCPRERVFDTCGRIELTSASGEYWQAADLFVCDHPYYAVTDVDGRFHFPLVPAGRYELVAWHPHWVATRTERNPETCLPSRLIYAPPLERSRPVVVAPGRTALANLTLP